MTLDQYNKLVELQGTRTELANQLKALGARQATWNEADRTTWDVTSHRYDATMAEIGELQAIPNNSRIGRDSGTIAAGPVNKDIFQNPGGSNVGNVKLSAPKYQFITNEGGVVRTIAPQDSLENLLISQGVQATASDNEETVGDAIRGYITGNYSNAKSEVMALAGAIGGKGGFLVSERLSARTIDVARNKSSVLRAGAQTISMDGPEMTIAKLLTDPTPAWVGEGGVIPTSNPTFGAATLHARKVGVIVYMSSELEEDAAGLMGLLTNSIGEAIALAIDSAALVGPPAGSKPTGIRYWPGITTTAIGGALAYDNLLDALTPIEAANGSATGWIAHPTQAASLRKLKDGNGNFLTGHPDIVPLQRLISKQQTAGEICFGDFSELLLAFRRNLRLEIFREGSILDDDGTTTISLLNRDLIAIRATVRMDTLVMRPTFFNYLTGIS